MSPEWTKADVRSRLLDNGPLSGEGDRKVSILFECGKCGCTNMAEEDVTYETFSQTQEEPGEYEIRCPECLSCAIEEMSAFWCKGCDDVQVKDDGDYCSECHQCMLEDRADARQDDMMMGAI